MIIEKTDVRISVATGINLSGATISLAYRAPDNREGTWTPVIDDAATGLVHYDLLPAENTPAGVWTIWATVVKGGKTIKTSARSIGTVREGTIG